MRPRALLPALAFARALALACLAALARCSSTPLPDASLERGDGPAIDAGSLSDAEREGDGDGAVTDASSLADAEPEPIDAKVHDTGGRDASRLDGSGPDAARPDAARLDAGVGDSGARDTGWSCDRSAMPTPNAGLSEAPGSGGCPRGMIRILPEAFCVDRYEASLVLVMAAGSTVSWSPYHHPGNRRVRAVSIAGAVPQGYIDGISAGAACAEARKRLCSDDEWRRACRGPRMSTYPYGNVRMSGVCNDARAVHPAVELYPQDPNPFSHLDDACLNQLPRSLSRSGDHPGCVSSEGAFDMMGNLHEWTSNTRGAFRGGFYVDTRINGEGCLYVTVAHGRQYWDYSTGFRCCAD